jgi:sugar transferase (PEP-CTERM/EpsH1 system associated)
VNILYLSHRIPYPPDKGDKIRSFHMLEHLARRHRVWCACFLDSPSEERYIDPLRAYCHDVAAVRLNRRLAAARGLVGLIGGGTITESFYAHAGMHRVLNTWREAVEFDVLVAFSSSMAPYALAVPAKRHVLDLCDLDSQKWIAYGATAKRPARWLYRTEGRRLEERERTWIDRFDATALVTEAEAATLDGRYRPAKIHVVGNGVRLPEPDENRSLATADRESGLENDGPAGKGTEPHTDDAAPPTVGFVGVMDYRPNVDAMQWFVSQCWPMIRRTVPEAEFRIIGRSPTWRVRRLASVPGVHVVGGVEDVTAELRRIDVSVAPMRIARGIQNKVLEAMAASRPVVLTSIAAQGISARHDEEFLVANRPKKFAQSVGRLLFDPADRRRLGHAARRFVAVHHCWEETLRRFELIVTGVVERAARHATLPRTAIPAEVVHAVEPAAAFSAETVAIAPG